MMTLIERKNYCEKIIEPYKEQLSDEALAEIRDIYEDYYFDDDPDIVYTEEELEEMGETEKFELWEMTWYVLEKNGFTFCYAEQDDDTYTM